MYRRLALTVGLLLALLGGCSQRNQPEDVVNVTVTVPAAARDSVRSADGSGAIERLELRYRPVVLAPASAEHVPGWSEPLLLTVGELAGIPDLAPGEYELQSRGFAAGSQTALAYGLDRVTVVDDDTSLTINLRAIIGSLELRTAADGESAGPGDTVEFRLEVLSVDPDYYVPAEAIDVQYEVVEGDATITAASGSGATILVSAAAAEAVTLRTTVSGFIVDDDGVVNEGKLQQQITVTVRSADTDPQPDPDPEPDPDPDPEPDPDPDPDPEPDPDPRPDPDPDPDPVPEPEPEPFSLDIHVPATVAGLVVDEQDNPAVASIRVRYRKLDPEAGPGEWHTPLELQPGGNAQLLLEAGDYEIDSHGHDRPGGTEIVAGTQLVTIDGSAAQLELQLHGLLGGVNLARLGESGPVNPGDLIEYRLVVRSAAPWLYLAADSYESPRITVLSRNAQAVFQPPDSLEVSVNSTADDGISLRVTVTGLTRQGGVLKWSSVSTRESIALSLPEPDDFQPPELVFNPFADAQLRGTATDERGIASVEVFEGPDLLGSTDPASGVTPIDFDSTDGSWSMNWEPGDSDAHVLRAEATDASGNRTVALQVVNLTSQQVPESTTELTTVSSTYTGEHEEFEDTGYCATNEFSTPGQGLQAVGAGLQAVGAIGGLLISDTPAPSADLITAARIADALNFELEDLGNPSGAVILVVDDFGLETDYSLPAELLQGSAGPARIAELAREGEITHGALVLHQLSSMLDALGFIEQPSAAPGRQEWRYTRIVQNGTIEQNWTIELRAVNIHGASTSGPDMNVTIPGLIRAALVEAEVGNVIVNMSFVMLPCSVQTDLEQSGIHTFEQYVQALALVNGLDDTDQLGVMLVDVATADPLLEYVDCPFAGNSGERDCMVTGDVVEDALIHVAAAGNFGSDYPLYPGAAANVIAVSSMDFTAGDFSVDERSGFSNQGQVMAPGAAFELVSTPGMTVAYAGTSFAAPVVSLYSALDVMGYRNCYPGSNHADGMNPPELARGQIADLPLHSTFGGALSAINQHCTEPVQAPDA